MSSRRHAGDRAAVRPAAVGIRTGTAAAVPAVMDVSALQLNTAAFTTRDGHAPFGGIPLHSRLLAVGRSLPEPEGLQSVASDARQEAQLRAPAPEWAGLTVPKSEMHRTFSALLATQVSPGSSAPAEGLAVSSATMKAIIDGSGTQMGCSYPLLVEEQMRPPPSSPAVAALLSMATHIVEPKGRALTEAAVGLSREPARRPLSRTRPSSYRSPNTGAYHLRRKARPRRDLSCKGLRLRPVQDVDGLRGQCTTPSEPCCGPNWRAGGSYPRMRLLRARLRSLPTEGLQPRRRRLCVCSSCSRV